MTLAVATPPARSANKVWLAALETTARLTEDPYRTLPVWIDQWAERFADRPALLSDCESFSFSQLADRARRYPRWALAQELGPGDVVALMMPNRPDYLAAWLGITRTGASVALINTNLSGEALVHSLTVASPQHVIVTSEFEDRVTAAEWTLCIETTVWLHGEGPEDRPRIDQAVDALSGAPLAEEETRRVPLSARALCIYTSGTTGLPKAANVSHHRVLSWAGWFSGLMGAGPDDRLYNCLPMYHSVGGVVATVGALVNGGSVVLREKFSVQAFWGDVARWDCTLFQYIGELCRYLLNAPERPEERAHRLRLACGNGLRPDVWSAFQDRFAIPQILEFYASTEGNFSLYNVEGEVGAMGRIPAFLSHRFPAALVRFDPEIGAPARDGAGRCIRCARGETGEAIGRVSSEGGRFEGYTSAEESEKKLLRDVFEPGDAWFRTGDLMRQDTRGFFYFIDRIGDTFRWKGENVSTGEVAAAIAACPGVIEAEVYGTPVPGADGKAGMAALVVDDAFSPEALRAHLATRLPAYARPVFLRLTEAIAATETFKPKKAVLAAEGYDLARVSDALFVDVGGAYAPLDAAMAARLASGQVRL